MTAFPRFDPHSAELHGDGESHASPTTDVATKPPENSSSFSRFSGGSHTDAHIDNLENASNISHCSIDNNNNNSLNVPPFIYVRAHEDENSPICASPPAKPSKIAKPSGARQNGFEVDLGAVPRDWFEGVRRLISMRCPGGVSAVQWRRTQMDAAVFLETWAAQASALGWTVWDVFGANRTKPIERVDMAGLVVVINGRELAALTDITAVISTRTGAGLTYRRKRIEPAIGQVLLWELGTEGR